MTQVSSVPQRTFSPAVQGFSSVQNVDTVLGAARVVTPGIKMGMDHFGGSLLSRIGGGARPLTSGGFTAMPSAGVAMGVGTSGGVMSGGARGLVSRVGSAASGALNSVLGALKSNALIAAAVSGLTNGLSFLMGKSTAQRAASNFVVDTGVYTAIGASSTLVGAALGSLIPVPFVGTAIGLAAGMSLGYLYEKTLRKPLSDKLANGVFSGLPN